MLIYPECEGSITNTVTYTLPLGLGSIATYCKQKFGDQIDIKILDSSIIPHGEQIESLKNFKPNIVGFAPTLASQKNSYKLAEGAKKNGADVFFGGVNSSALYNNMLKNRKFIDGVVLYDGEIPFSEIVKRKILGDSSLEGIPNLASRDKDGKVIPPERIYIPNLGELPNINYSLFDMKRFLKQARERGFGNAVSYYAGKGCAKRSTKGLETEYNFKEYTDLVSKMNTCTFCGRNELGFRLMEGKREEEIVKELYTKFGIRGFFNVQDTVNLKNKNPIGLDDSWFRVFIGAESITPENIKTLQSRYGKHLIFQVGVESADPNMRRNYKKPETSLDDMLRNVDLLKENNIQLHASFILGGRGETPESMEVTTGLAKKLAEYDNTSWVLISPQIILPGSPDYRELLKDPAMEEKYGDRDLIEIPEISEDFLKQSTNGITRRDILDEIKKTFEDIRKINPDLVLDAKGVIGWEEEYIQPSRPYIPSVKPVCETKD